MTYSVSQTQSDTVEREVLAAAEASKEPVEIRGHVTVSRDVR